MYFHNTFVFLIFIKIERMRVYKFGGASVKDADAVKHVGEILSKFGGEDLVVVVSAMGKTTNALEKVVEAYYNKTDDPFKLLEVVKVQHYELIDELFEDGNAIKASVNDLFVEVEWVIEDEVHDSYDYVYDQIVSTGELVSTRIISAYLNEIGYENEWLDIRDIIQTDNTYREGKVDWELTLANAQSKIPTILKNKKRAVTQGFLGVTSENHTTTLGREGSDYTAAILSYCLDAEGMSIWKDVPGILTADPRRFKNVTKIDRLSYKEAIEMTYYGAKVIHPKTIKPIQNKNIPLFVKSFLDPEGAGTVISGDLELNYPPVVVVEPNQALLHISTKDFSFVAEDHLGKLFTLFAKHRLKVNMMQNKAISFSVCVKNAPYRINKVMEEMKDEFHVVKDSGIELITVRHHQDALVESLKENKIVLIEDRGKSTIQMVLRPISKLQPINEEG